MELRQLRYFVAVGEELHFRRAALRLHMSQPPLSQQIRLLERELGCQLFTRNRRQVALTAAGAAFLHECRLLLADLDGIVAMARRIDAGQTGRLRISFVGSALLSFVPALVQRFRSTRPDVEIQLREMVTEDQISALRGGRVDIGLVPLPIDADDLVAEVLVKETLVAALPADHLLGRLRRIPLKRLAAEPFVLFPRSQAPTLHDQLLAGLRATGTDPLVTQYAPETQTIIGLVAAGIGVSLVQSSVQRLTLPGVIYRPVTSAPAVALGAIVRPGETSPLASDFLDLARGELS